MLPVYIPEIVDVDGKTIKSINDAISVQAARAFNTQGAASIVLPNYYDTSMFRMHTRMKLWRFDYDGVPANFGDTVWFLKKKINRRSEGIYKLDFVDAFAMIGTRKVAYTAVTPYADKTLDELLLITHNDTLRLDNMMRAYMRENFGSLALDVVRWNTSIDIEEDKNVGPHGEKQAAWQDLDAVLSDLASQASANGIALYYDLLPREDGTFFFRVWDRLRGVNRGSMSISNLVLSDKDGALTDIEEIEDYSNVATHCYVLGLDTGPSQVVGEVFDPLMIRNDIFGRIEMTANAADADVTSVLNAVGQAALNGRRAKRIINARVVESKNLRLHREIFYGDIVPVEVDGHKFDAAISAISVSWDSEGEQLDIRVSGEEVIGHILTGGVDIPVEPGIPLGNQPPLVNAGPDQTITIAETITLAGTVTDDGLPDPPALLTIIWTKVSGPGTVSFDDDSDVSTNATVSVIGTYILRLTASDGEFSVSDTITIVVETTSDLPFDNGLSPGQELVAGIGQESIYRTEDFQTVSGSGGPTWTEHSLSLGVGETVLSWVADPFSSGYLTGIGAINGWVVTQIAVYRVTDLFGAVASSVVYTFDVPIGTGTAPEQHWRTIQASFGAFFPADNPWLMVVSHSRDLATREGTYAVYSLDGGATWSGEVLITAHYDSGVDTDVRPISLYLSPKTPGLAYSVAYTETVSPAISAGYKTTDWGETWTLMAGSTTEDPLRPMPHFDVVSDNVSPPGAGFPVGGASRTKIVGQGGTELYTHRIFIMPPADAVSVVVGHYTFLIPEITGGAGYTADYELEHPAFAETTDTVDDAEITFTRHISQTEWPGNREQGGEIGFDASDFIYFDAHAHAVWGGGGEARVTIISAAWIKEIELEGGMIYTPPMALGAIEPQHRLAGDFHVPWMDNADELYIYHGYMDAGDVRLFKLIRVDGNQIVDISPVASDVSHGIGHYGFAGRAYDSGREFVAVGGRGNSFSGDDEHDTIGVWVSTDHGDNWTVVINPVDESKAKYGFSPAFSGTDENVLYIWGGWSNDIYPIHYTDDFGVTIDSRKGNLQSLEGGTPFAFIGIAGGPIPPP